LLRQLAIGLHQGLPRFLQGLRIGRRQGLCFLPVQGDFEQVILLHQPFDLFLRPSQLARVQGGRLDGKRLLELGFEDGLVRLQLARLLL
jgi:hypothetical protein